MKSVQSKIQKSWFYYVYVFMYYVYLFSATLKRGRNHSNYLNFRKKYHRSFHRCYLIYIWRTWCKIQQNQEKIDFLSNVFNFGYSEKRQNTLSLLYLIRFWPIFMKLSEMIAFHHLNDLSLSLNKLEKYTLHMRS